MGIWGRPHCLATPEKGLSLEGFREPKRILPFTREATEGIELICGVLMFLFDLVVMKDKRF